MLRRFSVFSLAFLLCLSLFPARAFAWDVIPKGVLYQGDVEGSNYGAVVSAYNQFDAACYVMGKDPNTISASIKQKLSDPNYGGKFYEYSQTFFTQSGALENVPGWVPTYVVMISELGDLMLSDYQSVWYSTTTKALHDAALVDFKRVLLGEDLYEPEPVTPVSSDYYVFSGNAWLSNSSHWTMQKYYFNGNGGTQYSLNMSLYTHVSNPISVRVPSSALENLNSVCPAGTVPWYIQVSIYQGGISSVYVYASQYFTVTNNSYTENGVSYPCINQVTKRNSNPLYSVSLGTSYQFDGSTLTFSQTSPASVSSTTNSQFGISSSVDRFLLAYGSGSSPAAPVVPPPSGVWPVAPSVSGVPAPVLPEPAEPVVETPVTPTVPAPVWPDITINIEPDPVPGTTPSGLDYTELLTRINDNLISIDSFARAINSNLNSLRSDLLAEFNGVIDSLRNIYNYLLTIDSVLETHCTHLRNKMEESAVFIANYMRTLIKWLAEQLDYDDMTNVEAPDNSLLTTINEKLGGGTYEPNPIKDEQGYYEWLDDLWDRFLLGDNWQSSMGSISGSFSELKTRFPFSVPWDIVALFRLFVHDPVTPVFDLPLYFSPDGSTPVHVDLSPWDSVASLVRPMIFVIFALKLALLSRDLLGGLGADKGGL